MKKIKHLRKLVLAVALAAAFPQAALACRWYDVRCQVREEEQRLEREADAAFEAAKEESERLLREAQAELRRIDLPGIENATIQALWHAATDAESFALGLVNHIRAAATNAEGLLLSDVKGMLQTLTLEQVMPKAVLDHIQTAEVAGSPLNQHIHKLAHRHRKHTLPDGAVIPVRPPVVQSAPSPSFSNSITASAKATNQFGPTSNAVGVGQSGSKYSFSVIPSLNVLALTSLICKAAPGEEENPYAALCPDLSMSVGFPLLTVSQKLHAAGSNENKVTVHLPQADEFPVKLSIGTIWQLPVPDVLKKSIDASAGLAVKFGVNMTCLSHPIGSCRIDSFTLKGALKGGMDTLKTMEATYKAAKQAVNYINRIPELGWQAVQLEEMMAAVNPELYALAEEADSLDTILSANESVEGIGQELWMGNEVEAVEGGATNGEVIGEILSYRTEALQEAPDTIETVLNNLIDTQMPGEVASDMTAVVGEGLDEMRQGADVLADLMEPFADVIENVSVSSSNGDPNLDIFGEFSKFCESESWKMFQTRMLSTECNLDTKLDLSMGLVWRNPYATLPDNQWRNGYKMHASPDVFKMGITIKEIGQIEWKYVNLFAIKPRLGAVFTGNFVYVPLTTLGANVTDDGNEEDLDLD